MSGSLARFQQQGLGLVRMTDLQETALQSAFRAVPAIRCRS
jgi:hypothetical protein